MNGGIDAAEAPVVFPVPDHSLPQVNFFRIEPFRHRFPIPVVELDIRPVPGRLRGVCPAAVEFRHIFEIKFQGGLSRSFFRTHAKCCDAFFQRETVSAVFRRDRCAVHLKLQIFHPFFLNGELNGTSRYADLCNGIFPVAVKRGIFGLGELLINTGDFLLHHTDFVKVGSFGKTGLQLFV